MNPIKNKKDLEATIDDIRSFAYSYLEKYSPSKQQLRIYLWPFLFSNLAKVKTIGLPLIFFTSVSLTSNIFSLENIIGNSKTTFGV